jgi:hypothetical protein
LALLRQKVSEIGGVKEEGETHANIPSLTMFPGSGISFTQAEKERKLSYLRDSIRKQGIPVERRTRSAASRTKGGAGRLTDFFVEENIARKQFSI